MSKMDLAALTREILESNRERLINIAKRVAIPFAVLPLLWMFFLRRTGVDGQGKVVSKPVVKDTNEEDGVVYNLRNLSLPRLYGWRLKLFTRIASSKFGRTFIAPKSMKDSNMFIFRSIDMLERPTLYPVVPAKSVKAIDVNNGETDIDIWSMLKESEKEASDFQFNSISDFVFAYRSSKCTPTDVAKRIITAIEESNAMDPALNIIIQTNKEEIIEMAEASTARYKRNEPLSIFDGIPITAKDEVRVAGYRCYDGAPFLGETIETEETESPVVNKLRKGGAVIIGIANMHQLGMGTTGCNGSRLHGTCRNPYNTNHFCGGSSSGSGAAVACGMVPMALGVDGGGSIRIPAASCGNVGVKASYGRISNTGLFPFSDTVGHLGPMCNTVRDCAIAYAFTAGPDPLFPPGLGQPPVELKDFENLDLSGMKIGIDWEYFKHGDSIVVDYCMQAVKFLEDEFKAEVVSINIPELEEARAAHMITITSEFASRAIKMRAEHGDELMQDSQVVLGLVDGLSAVDYIQAQRQKTRSMIAFEKLFKDVDCIITPTMPITMINVEPGAFDTGLLDADFTGKSMRYMFIGNLIGVPSITVPVGYDEKNMPIGLQITTQWWDESTMFRFGHAAEKFLKKKNKPQVYFELL